MGPLLGWRVALFGFALGCAVSLGGCGAVNREVRKITTFPRATFTDPGDMVSMSPSPESGFPFDGDPGNDCSTCTPR